MSRLLTGTVNHDILEQVHEYVLLSNHANNFSFRPRVRHNMVIMLNDVTFLNNRNKIRYLPDYIWNDKIRFGEIFLCMCSTIKKIQLASFPITSLLRYTIQIFLTKRKMNKFRCGRRYLTVGCILHTLTLSDSDNECCCQVRLPFAMWT